VGKDLVCTDLAVEHHTEIVCTDLTVDQILLVSFSTYSLGLSITRVDN